MNKETRQNHMVPFLGLILGIGISSILLFLFFEIPSLLLLDSFEFMEISGIVYIIITTSILIYFRGNVYFLGMFRVVYWSGLVIFCSIVFFVSISGLGWVAIINPPVIIWEVLIATFLIGIFLFWKIEKMVLQIPPNHIIQKFKSLLIDEKPRL